MKRSFQIVAALIAVVLGFTGLVLVYLVHVGTPGHSRTMKFEGYIGLPSGGVLNVLDYLTLSHGNLFVTSESSGALFKVKLDPSHPAASTVLEMQGHGAVHGIALLPQTNVAFITRSEDNTVDVFDANSLQRLGRIPVADDADAILYEPASKLIYVANGDPKLATLIDSERRVTVGTIHLPGKPEFPALDAQTGLLYQNLQDINSVVAIDLGKRSVVGRWSLDPCEGPSGMAIDAAERRLFAVCSGNAELVVFNLETHRVITSLKIGGGPDSVAIDRSLHRIYTAGKAGKLAVIQQDNPNSYRVLELIDTHYGAHTLAVDPMSHQVFVAYASLFGRPRVAVFSALI